jgi:hypothetical protein
MKKNIIPILLIVASFLSSNGNVHAQSTLTPEAVIKSFPYQHTIEASAALTAMDAWKNADWKTFFNAVEDTAQQTSFTYALHAYVNKVSLDEKLKIPFIAILKKQIKKANSEYAKILFQEELKLLSKEDYVNNRLQLAQPKWEEGAGKAFTTNPNPVQRLLYLQKQLEKPTNPVQKKNIIWEASKIPGFSSFMFVAQFLNDEALNTSAAQILTKLALNDANIRGSEVRSILEKSLTLLHGEDSSILVPALKVHLKKMPYDYGFISLFNGKDLTGWKGLVANPIARSKMSAAELHHYLIETLKTEFDYNSSQQIYVNPEIWNAVIRMKDQNIYEAVHRGCQ